MSDFKSLELKMSFFTKESLIVFNENKVILDFDEKERRKQRARRSGEPSPGSQEVKVGTRFVNPRRVRVGRTARQT